MPLSDNQQAMYYVVGSILAGLGQFALPADTPILYRFLLFIAVMGGTAILKEYSGGQISSSPIPINPLLSSMAAPAATKIGNCSQCGAAIYLPVPFSTGTQPTNK